MPKGRTGGATAASVSETAGPAQPRLALLSAVRVVVSAGGKCSLWKLRLGLLVLVIKKKGDTIFAFLSIFFFELFLTFVYVGHLGIYLNTK